MTQISNLFILSLLFLISILPFDLRSQDFNNSKWISDAAIANTIDTIPLWTCYRKQFQASENPKNVIIKIATDTKYWLWINGNMVVFEGGLKQGPTPNDSYFDEVDISKDIVKGKNTIAILTWYFGKQGFSHKSSGKHSLIVDSNNPMLNLSSNNSWKAIHNSAYTDTDFPKPNFRLPESNIRFDANKSLGDWFKPDFDDTAWPNAFEVGKVNDQPWGKLVKRPTPLFKNFGLTSYVNENKFPSNSSGDTISADLPYNAQVTPYFKIEAPAGLKIEMLTDNYLVGGNKEFTSVRAEYITKNGIQEYESFGWMNGHSVKYIFPKGTKILSLKFRETGYNTSFAGSFHCDDEFLNKLWEKARRTLYLNMRDTYMDCPDRERAQWWGDVVLELGEAFYTFDTSANALSRKGFSELANWQRKDKTMYSPIPDGKWFNELPPQILAAISTYGIWTYYMYTGDKGLLSKMYPHIKDYLSIWTLDQDNLVVHRKGGWDWHDWGQNMDVPLLDNAWYTLALQSAINIGNETGQRTENANYQDQINKIKIAFNKKFWSGSFYQSKGMTVVDDRANAMAILAGIADKAQEEKAIAVFQKSFHASPYIEKYVEEALFVLGKPLLGIERIRTRYTPMVDSPLTTLWENFRSTDQDTYNHGWSGGPLTLMSQYIAGLAPLTPGYKTFQIKPMPGNLKSIQTKTVTVKGDISLDLKLTVNEVSMAIGIPANTEALVGIPKLGKEIVSVLLNNEVIWKNHQATKKSSHPKFIKEDEDYLYFNVKPGKFQLLGKFK
ncbi:MAG TPA: alpha-L-rhamnosidase C-terminal domain-containing protein [Cytophagaceae bacterium]|jgi:hypothetical protein